MAMAAGRIMRDCVSSMGQAAKTGIRLCPARTGDLPAIGAIVVRSWRASFRGIVPDGYLDALSEAGQAERHRRTLGRENVTGYVATDAGAVVGFGSGGPSRWPDQAAESEVYALYLLPGMERQGIGRMLFDRVAADHTASGRRGLVAVALERNPARVAYARWGGRPVPAPPAMLGGALLAQVAYLWDRTVAGGAG